MLSFLEKIRYSKDDKPAINDRLVRRTVALAFELYGI